MDWKQVARFRLLRVRITHKCKGGAMYLQSSTELTIRHQQRDIVATDKILSHAHDGGRQTVLPVMVRAVLCYIARQLCHLPQTPTMEMSITNTDETHMHTLKEPHTNSSTPQTRK